MLTVTTPFRLNETPSYQGLAGEPAMKPPPWIQTSTGRPSSGFLEGLGVKTFRLRMESPGMEGSGVMISSESGSFRCGVAP